MKWRFALEFSSATRMSPLLGALAPATHDIGVELSHRTEQITHRISPEVDAERADLAKANGLGEPRWIDAFHKELRGRNGGGDPWRTDGRLPVAPLPISKL